MHQSPAPAHVRDGRLRARAHTCARPAEGVHLSNELKTEREGERERARARGRRQGGGGEESERGGGGGGLRPPASARARTRSLARSIEGEGNRKPLGRARESERARSHHSRPRTYRVPEQNPQFEHLPTSLLAFVVEKKTGENTVVSQMQVPLALVGKTMLAYLEDGQEAVVMCDEVLYVYIYVSLYLCLYIYIYI
jgi:hypothetical protein